MSDATAAPVEIVLGDKTYRMSPLTDRDYAELDNWFRMRTIRMAVESITESMPEATQQRIVSTAIEYANGLTWLSKAGSALLLTLDGQAQYYWQGIRHNHPEVTVETIREFLGDKLIRRIMPLVYNLVNGDGDAKKNEVEKPSG